ncbi:MAG: hypothetical protein AABZ54_07510 [Bacteroidota bacterium]
MMKTLLLLFAIALGVFFPYGHEYTFLIRYFLMLMLFFSFLDVKIDKKIIRKSHFVILGTVIFVSIIVYFLLKPFNQILAETAFVTAIAPTAIAAPVIISLKKEKVEFVTFSLLLNNVSIALLLPFLLPLLMNSGSDISVGKVLIPVITTLSIPFAAAQLIKFISPKIWQRLINWKDSSFYILVINIYIATSEASYYIRSELTNSLEIVFLIAAISASLCILFFTLGWFIGGQEFSSEASQSLGQKNNAFTIWISLTFINPLAVLGPVFYVFIQNIYISWELYKHHHAVDSVFGNDR